MHLNFEDRSQGKRGEEAIAMLIIQLSIENHGEVASISHINRLDIFLLTML